MTDAMLLVRNAMLITLAPGENKPFTGWFTVDDLGKIMGIDAGAPPAGVAAEHEIDAKGAFVAPGFISAHSHLSTSGSRGPRSIPPEPLKNHSGATPTAPGAGRPPATPA